MLFSTGSEATHRTDGIRRDGKSLKGGSKLKQDGSKQDGPKLGFAIEAGLVAAIAEALPPAIGITSAIAEGVAQLIDKANKS